MKQKDLALIIVVVFISGLLSYFLSKTFISSSKNRKQQVEVVKPITSDFNKPSNKFFNSKSIDPTQLIKISNNNNKNPF